MFLQINLKKMLKAFVFVNFFLSSVLIAHGTKQFSCPVMPFPPLNFSAKVIKNKKEHAVLLSWNPIMAFRGKKFKLFRDGKCIKTFHAGDLKQQFKDKIQTPDREHRYRLTVYGGNDYKLSSIELVFRPSSCNVAVRVSPIPGPSPTPISIQPPQVIPK